MIRTAVIIGSGNVAAILGKALLDAGVRITAVYSRNKEHAVSLAKILGADVLNDTRIPEGTDLVLIAVNDEAIPLVSDEISTTALVVHTSGSTDMEVLKHHPEHGVFYPLQSLSKDKKISMNNVPLLIEANSADSLDVLKNLASRISSDVTEVNSAQRKIVHLAAVFANNFTNHLYVIAKQLLDKHGLPFDLMKPLIKNTAEKVMQSDPYDMQTGPALRSDTRTINAHLELLKAFPDYRQLYEILSRDIHAAHTKND